LRCLRKVVSATRRAGLLPATACGQIRSANGGCAGRSGGVRVGERHQPIRDDPVASQPLVGLGQQLSDGSNRVGEFADQPPEPPRSHGGPARLDRGRHRGVGGCPG